MLAAAYGHLPVARLLVETYHCDVNAKSDKVSGWDLTVQHSNVLLMVVTLQENGGDNNVHSDIMERYLHLFNAFLILTVLDNF